ncbi:MAG: TolC family protein [Paludibacter sp.]|nr:TolC family protein [Paludibacter sp.]MBP9578409.1 TolC family protein [Parabacteroides sp.]MDD3064069.1 TolC family protein [Massilibacteroides sp.]
MKAIIISILALFGSISLYAQNNTNSVLTSIEENNTTLKALRETAESQKLENRTGIYLSNPEIGFNYLWGNPVDMGNRTDFSVTQTFDIPTITGMKSKVANGKNDLVEWQYKADRMNIMLEAKQYCIELIYYNALGKELNLRLEHAQTIAESYKKRLATGDANKLEYNKIQLNLSSVQGEMSRIEVERNTLLSQLKRLNGGKDVIFDESQFAQIQLPLNFDDWFINAEQKNPVLAYIKQEIEVSKRQVSVSKAMGLPTFSAGYMSEKVVGQRFQGVSVGVSIPLWENKNRVKQAKAAVRAAESREADSKQQFYSNLQIQFNRAMGLQNTAQAYRKSLFTANSTDLLKKALDAGEISLLDYMVEIGLYYETVNQALQAEMDYQKAFAELSAVEL